MRMLRASMALGTISTMALVSALPERKLTKEFLESEIDTVEYNRFGDTNTHCTIKTKSGFSFTGESACVDPNNFDQKIGEKFAYENAFNKMWTPYGFWLHKALAESDSFETKEAYDAWHATGIKELCQGNILPKDEQCSVSEDFSFGHAIASLKLGHRVARAGWNGKGMFLYYVPENKYPASRNEHGTMVGVFEDDMVPYGAYIAMKTAQNNVVPWLASQTDVLAEDWQIVE